MKIAFIDHHLNNFHSDKFLGLFRNELAGKGIEVTVAWESDPTGDDWCEKNGVKRAASIEEAMQEVDGVIVLAPDNLEEHLALCERVLPFGKPTVIDKFLAPSVKDSDKIIALADKYNTPIHSASSLRYAVELLAALPNIEKPVADVSIRGFGYWMIYGVHTVAMATRLMGPGLKRLIDTGTPTSRIITLDYGHGRKALIECRDGENAPEPFNWRFAAKSGDKYVTGDIADYAGFYQNMIADASDFLLSGKDEMSIVEARDLVMVLEGANLSQERGGVWVGAEEFGDLP